MTMTSNPASTPLSLLHKIRAAAGERQTTGLPDEDIVRFAAVDASLVEAIEQAIQGQAELLQAGVDCAVAETELAARLQRDFVNFYRPEAVNPYVALAAQGPWVITAHGAVLHDSGGYGMLGFGHNPAPVLAAMSRPQVMANVMTPSFSQEWFAAAMRRELGHSRAGGCPFHRFICLNSGSEAMTAALRLSDVNAKRMTDVGARHAGKPIHTLAFQGAFHGRTSRPARVSDSCRGAYEANLASFRQHDDLLIVPHNDEQALVDVFAQAEISGTFIEAVVLEPVQGEGAPGRALSRSFYDFARRLTAEHGSLLIIDSIQAGLRTHGVLSIVDYPGFADCEAPDIETWSKALNGGQYPLSVLGLSERAAALYAHGVYGNTMTTNPRALDVAVAILGLVTPELRENVRARGVEFAEKLTAMQSEFPGLIESVEGTGLLLCAELRRDVNVLKKGGVEEQCRKIGIGVIHGGQNALRFTPHLWITSEEIDLILEQLRIVFAGLPQA